MSEENFTTLPGRTDSPLTGSPPKENEARSMEQSLTLGWELLSELPREELDRVDNETLEKFYHPVKE